MTFRVTKTVTRRERDVWSSRKTKIYQVTHLGYGRYAEPEITFVTTSGTVA